MKDAMDEANNDPSFELSSLARQDIVNWVHRGYDFLQESKVMVQRFLKVCGITTTNSGLFGNDDFLKRIMATVEVDCDRTDHDDMFKDLFEN